MKLWWSPTKCADQCHHVELKVWAGGEAESATPATICRDLQGSSSRLLGAAMWRAASSDSLLLQSIPGPRRSTSAVPAAVQCAVPVVTCPLLHSAPLQWPRRTAGSHPLTPHPDAGAYHHDQICKMGFDILKWSLFMKEKQFLCFRLMKIFNVSSICRYPDLPQPI